jgi:Mat/Ecp fimbriae major subunit
MKNIVKFAVAASMVSAFALGSTAAQAASADATATAKILAPVSVTKNTDLDFGTIAVGASGGSAVISVTGARTCSGGLLCSTGTPSAAGFTIAGETGETVGISVADIAGDPDVVHLSNGSATMNATLTLSSSGYVLDGTDTFSVGGVLGVAASQAAGTYNGTFRATVNYQ